MVGPMAGATDMTIEMLPIVLPRASGGTSVIDRGHQQRHHDRRAGGLDDAAEDQQREAGRSGRRSACRREKIDIARMKIGRVFMRCSRKPVTGMTTAMVSRNAVVSHCAALAVTPGRPSGAGWRRS